MSSKVDTLFNKATTFEKLALYGDRKVYLAAIAQAGAPDVSALITSINTARMNILKTINNFWRQDYTKFPMAAREAYSALAYPQTDITTATGEQLTFVMDQLVTALTSIYRNLANSGDNRSSTFASQTVYPALEHIQGQVDKYKGAQSSMPTSQPEEGTLKLPEQKITGQPPTNRVSVDPTTLKAIQNFINQEMVVQRQSATPITPNGVWNTETANMLQQWGKANNLPIHNMQALIDAAKMKT